MMEKSEKSKNGLVIVGIVLGIIGICLSFIPILNNISFVLGILSLLFGIIALIKKHNKGKAIATIILGVLSIVITLSLQSSWSDSLDDLSNDLDNMSGENTEEVLNNLDVEIGDFEVETNEYGFSETRLVVKITNKTSKSKSFNLEIEAVAADGSRIKTDYIYASNLAANQSQEFEIFTYVEDDKLEQMQSAKFNIIEASMYQKIKDLLNRVDFLIILK